MSIHVMNKVWRESPAKGSELLLLLAMADWADDEGWCWPSMDTLARKTRLSRRQVINIIKTCEEKKYIKVDRSTGKTKSNRYQVVTGENFSPASLFDNDDDFTSLVNPTSPELVNPTSPNTSIDTSNTRQDSKESGKAPKSQHQEANRFVTAFYDALGVQPPKQRGLSIKKAKDLIENGCTIDELPQYVAWLESLDWRKGPVTLQFAAAGSVWEQWRIQREQGPKQSVRRPVL